MSGSIVTAMQPDAPGFYGKVPGVGDFVSRRLPQDFIQVWDQWLQDAISNSREQLGHEWLEVYLTSPIWRFALSPGIAGPDSWTGILMPSVDRVGRYFPFTLAYRLSPRTNLFELARSDQAWFESAEALALSVLEDDTPTLDMLDASAITLGSPYVGSVMAPLAGESVGWWLPDADEQGFEETLSALLPGLADKQIDSCCIWWSIGSECVDKGIALSKRLPESAGFTAMLAGDWDAYGWEDLSPGLAGEMESEK